MSLSRPLRDGVLMAIGSVLAGLCLDARGRGDSLAQEPGPIPVVAQVPGRTYYVGQAIELRVGAEAAGDRPEVLTPDIANTEVTLIGNELSPIAATGIGNLTGERNLFITRFRLLPRRAGVLVIPPVRVRLGARTGSSRSLKVEVNSLPLAGRPAGFLGGVGGFALQAEAEPSTVRVGQDLTYTIHVQGPAARGMTGSPDLARFANVPLGLQIDPLPTIPASSPPSRQYRYRLRPTRSGTGVLPPVAVAAFDPATARYLTRVTPSVPIRVVEVPRFDPRALDYPPPPARSSSEVPSPWTFRRAGSVALGIAALVLIRFTARAVWRRWTAHPGRWLVRRARGLDSRWPADRAAREIRAVLAEYLERSTGRPRGVLTPEEASAAITALTPLSDNALGPRSAQLIADCDRASYSDQETDGGTLVAEARSLFREIGALASPPSRAP